MIRRFQLLVVVAATLSGCAYVYVPAPKAIDETTTKIALESLTLPEREFPTQSKDGEPAVVWAELKLPRQGADQVPAVILMHGCGGGGPSAVAWADEINRMGVAALVLDSFGGRGLRDTCTGRERINLGSRVIDAYRALEFLARDSRIDPRRIVLMGFSQGGAVTLLARYARFQRLWLRGAEEFAAYVAFYPGVCNRKLSDEDHVSERPLRILHGTADDWTPIGPCREYVERMQHIGKNVALFEYPEARHAFDSANLLASSFRANVLNSTGCTFVERPDGRFTVLHRNSGARVTPDLPCISRGATLGYNPAARRQAIQDVKIFLDELLKTGPDP